MTDNTLIEIGTLLIAIMGGSAFVALLAYVVITIVERSNKK